jgi:hypothetical protein
MRKIIITTVAAASLLTAAFIAKSYLPCGWVMTYHVPVYTCGSAQAPDADLGPSRS